MFWRNLGERQVAFEETLLHGIPVMRTYIMFETDVKIIVWF